MEQVIENLLSNALKFGIGKPVTFGSDRTGVGTQLEVQDWGIGMSPDQQARIFGRFEQVMASTGAAASASACGSSNRLVTAMGGRIAVVKPRGRRLDIHRDASPLAFRTGADRRMSEPEVDSCGEDERDRAGA